MRTTWGSSSVDRFLPVQRFPFANLIKTCSRISCRSAKIHGMRSSITPFCPQPHFSQHLPHCRQSWTGVIGQLPEKEWVQYSVCIFCERFYHITINIPNENLPLINYRPKKTAPYADRMSLELQDGQAGRVLPSHENSSPHSLQQHSGQPGSKT